MTARMKKFIINLLLVFFIGVLLYSGYNLFKIFSEYGKGRSEYSRTSKEVVTEKEPEPSGETPSKEKIETAPIDVDFDKLLKKNSDVCGWIYCPKTVVNYPVMHAKDNDFYLHRMVNKEYNFAGCIFEDYRNTPGQVDPATILYGHHMKDGSMFAQLKKLVDPKFCEEHPQLELITPEGKYHLLIWAFLNQPSDSGIYMTNFTDVEQCEEHIELARSLADYTTDVEVTPEDTLVELSTCAYEFEEARYIVICKMVPWEN